MRPEPAKELKLKLVARGWGSSVWQLELGKSHKTSFSRLPGRRFLLDLLVFGKPEPGIGLGC